MSEELKGDSVAPEQASGQTQETIAHGSSGSDDVVKYDTYRKTLGEAKRAKSELEETRQRLTALEQERLAADGKKDELIDALRKENDSVKGKLSTAVGGFAKGKVRESLMAEATKLGCQDPEILLRAYGNDVSDIDFDEEFNPDRDQVKMLLEKIRAEKSYLFSKDAPKIASHQINTNQSTVKSKSIRQMDDADLMAAWDRANKK